MTNLQNDNITHFDAPFRQKKNKAWSLGFDPKQLRSNRIKVGDLEKVKTAESALLQDQYQSQFRIHVQRDKYLRYYLTCCNIRAVSFA